MASSAPGGILLLATRIPGTATSPTTAEAKLTVGPFPRRAAVFVAADGFAEYHRHDSQNAGITLTIHDGGLKVMDDSFEARSSDLSFRAAAAHMFVLEPATSRKLIARVTPLGNGGAAGNINAQVNLEVTAIDVA
jgi:hypothetical protein